ncbi:hypothetical protein MF672_006255 [Actinomadura sp. ATCC 31491]|uniref:Uncharacterized protein n=1 Tax=Actinomadura luzonensis TaxID=2805427 RepID=A0ABT0FM94_9ACTN|nr:hypothetical protein [Actinomadura luzonensis]MCK2213397.1 hypothetical protein [Actinomadura luzonensis]
MNRMTKAAGSAVVAGGLLLAASSPAQAATTVKVECHTYAGTAFRYELEATASFENLPGGGRAWQKLTFRINHGGSGSRVVMRIRDRYRNAWAFERTVEAGTTYTALPLVDGGRPLVTNTDHVDDQVIFGADFATSQDPDPRCVVRTAPM